MAKTPVKVDRAGLLSALAAAECNGPLANRSILWAKAADLYNACITTSKPITASIVYLRVREWNLSVITPVGKRGRSSGFKPTGKRTAKKDKIAANTEFQKSLVLMRKNMSSAADSARFLPLVDRIEAGSRTAALKLHCVECGGWSTVEVRKCACTTCALWMFRPYQKMDSTVESEMEAAA